jgi:hypothetical protein
VVVGVGEWLSDAFNVLLLLLLSLPPQPSYRWCCGTAVTIAAKCSCHSDRDCFFTSNCRAWVRVRVRVRVRVSLFSCIPHPFVGLQVGVCYLSRAFNG